MLLRQQQFRAADDPGVSCRYAKGFLLGKIYNAPLGAGTRNARPSTARPRRAAENHVGPAGRSSPRVEDSMTAEELRGIEGEAAQLYFSALMP